ncbi:30S ribosomal protein S17 [Candidatus Falkowbacteria bacterium]|nr:30S ribosomal protein S17 [Candidatus Falkowbacteria bacterium]
MSKRKLAGIIVSDKSDKTVVVKVEKTKVHPKYLKRYIVSKKYKVDDPKNEYKIGDRVIFVECRPISKDKKWRVLSKVSKVN